MKKIFLFILIFCSISSVSAYTKKDLKQDYSKQLKKLDDEYESDKCDDNQSYYEKYTYPLREYTFFVYIHKLALPSSDYENRMKLISELPKDEKKEIMERVFQLSGNNDLFTLSNEELIKHLYGTYSYLASFLEEYNCKSQDRLKKDIKELKKINKKYRKELALLINQLNEKYLDEFIKEQKNGGFSNPEIYKEIFDTSTFEEKHEKWVEEREKKYKAKREQLENEYKEISENL